MKSELTIMATGDLAGVIERLLIDGARFRDLLEILRDAGHAKDLDLVENPYGEWDVHSRTSEGKFHCESFPTFAQAAARCVELLTGGDDDTDN
jgi:hypothetical protein